jgi:hypothetical protein
MAIAFVGGQAGGRAGSVSTLSVNYALTGGTDAAPIAGDLVLIGVGIASAGRTPACAVTDPATWINYGQQNADDGNDAHLDVSAKFMGGTPDTAFTLPATGHIDDAQTYAVLVFRGVDAAIDDATAVGTSGIDTGRPNPPSITPVTAGAWPVVFGAGACGTAATFTAPANYTTNFQTAVGNDVNDSAIGAGYRSDWSSGAEDPANFTGGTTNPAHSWAAYTLALKPASGGGGSDAVPQVWQQYRGRRAS